MTFPATLDSFPDLVDRHDGEDISGDAVTVPAASPYIGWLRQSPKTGTNITVDGLTRVPWGMPLSEGKYSCRERDAKLLFHSTAAATVFTFAYTGVGSPYRAKEINELADAIEAIEAFSLGFLSVIERHTFFPGTVFTTPSGQYIDRYAFDQARIGLAQLVSVEIVAPPALATVPPTADTVLEIGTDSTFTDPAQTAQVTLPLADNHVLASVEIPINVNLDQQLYLRLTAGNHEHLQIRAQIAILDTPAD